jgi:hypothetical protein
MFDPGFGLLIWIIGMDVALVLWNLAQYIEAKRVVLLRESDEKYKEKQLSSL